MMPIHLPIEDTYRNLQRVPDFYMTLREAMQTSYFLNVLCKAQIGGPLNLRRICTYLPVPQNGVETLVPIF